MATNTRVEDAIAQAHARLAAIVPPGRLPQAVAARPLVLSKRDDVFHVGEFLDILGLDHLTVNTPKVTRTPDLTTISGTSDLLGVTGMPVTLTIGQANGRLMRRLDMHPPPGHHLAIP